MPPTMPPYAPDPSDLVDARRKVTVPWLTFFNALVAQINSLIIIVGGGITQLTGPVTTPGGGSGATTITPTGVTPGTYGDATNVGQFTVNAAGQLTFAANVAISGGGVPSPLDAHYEPVTNGDPVNPDLIYNSGGDVVMGWVT
jgi:hypothetical protein